MKPRHPFWTLKLAGHRPAGCAIASSPSNYPVIFAPVVPFGGGTLPWLPLGKCHDYITLAFFAVEKKAPGIYSSQMQLSVCAKSTWRCVWQYVHCMQNSRNELGGPTSISAPRGAKNRVSMSFTFTVSSTWPGSNQREVFNQQLIWHLVKEEAEVNLPVDAVCEEAKLTQIWKICQPKECVLRINQTSKNSKSGWDSAMMRNDGVRWGFGLQICRQWHKS